MKGMGGAMDLVAGAQNIIVVMTHASKTANPNYSRNVPCRSPVQAVFAGYSPISRYWKLATAPLFCANTPPASALTKLPVKRPDGWSLPMTSAKCASLRRQYERSRYRLRATYANRQFSRRLVFLSAVELGAAVVRGLLERNSYRPEPLTN